MQEVYFSILNNIQKLIVDFNGLNSYNEITHPAKINDHQIDSILFFYRNNEKKEKKS